MFLLPGLAQRMVNIEGYLPGKKIVILGSGDIGLIMARRLTLEGCKVKGVYELMPFSTGLLRNISQCLEDYDIPLYLSHTVTNIIGGKRLEAVQVCSVDSALKPVLSSAKTIKCDTLLLSVGLIPENELAKTCGITIDKNTGGPVVGEDFQTSVPGIFSCGNSLFVYDLVDNVTEDGYKAAETQPLPGGLDYAKTLSSRQLQDFDSRQKKILMHSRNLIKTLLIYFRAKMSHMPYHRKFQAKRMWILK